MKGLSSQLLFLEFSVVILRKVVVKQHRTQRENHLKLSCNYCNYFEKYVNSHSAECFYQNCQAKSKTKKCELTLVTLKVGS